MTDDRRVEDSGPADGVERRIRQRRAGARTGPEFTDQLLTEAGAVELEQHVRIAQASARRWMAIFGVCGGVCVALALVISVWVIQDRNSSGRETRHTVQNLTDQVETLTGQLNEAQRTLDASRVNETEQGQCELKWAALTRIASQDYFAALGDLVVTGVSTPRDEARITAAINELVDKSADYHDAVERINAWAALPTESQLPCPVTDDQLR